MKNKTVEYFVQIIQQSNKISKKEKEILVNRFYGRTLDQIGKKYKVSGERIRQIEELAINKFINKISQLLLFNNS